MTARQYIGSRYVPKFASPAQWDNKKTYEALTIVLNQGNSYTSMQPVPTGIDITNADFWAETGNYNAQVEQYRQEVKTLSDKTDNINNILSSSSNFELAVYPIDNSATSDDVQKFINNHPGGVYFPAGRYNIYKTITIPFNNGDGFSFEASDGARFVAKNTISSMFVFGDNANNQNNANPVNELFTVKGGRFFGNGLASTALNFTENIVGIRIYDSIFNDFYGSTIFIDTPSISPSTDGIISRIRINYVQYPQKMYGQIGIENNANDLEISDTYICGCGTSIKTTGYIYGSNLHLYADYKTNQKYARTVGLDCNASAMLDNIYLDSVTIGLDFHNMPKMHTLGNVFYTAYFKKSLIHVIEMSASDVMQISNIRFSLGDGQPDGADIRYIAAMKTGTSDNAVSCAYLSLQSISNYKICSSNWRLLDAAFTESNHNPLNFTITDRVYLNANQGLLIGYIIKRDSGTSAFSKFGLYCDNGYAVTNDFVLHVTPTDTPNILSTRVAGFTNRDNGCHIAIGFERNINGITMYPVYVYTKNNTNINPIYINQSFSIFGLLCQYAGGSQQTQDILSLTNSNTLATTESNGNVA